MTSRNIVLAMVAALSFAAFSTSANATSKQSSIEYYGGKKQYDHKIEAAAIRKAAEKIGDLRGSLEGNVDAYIIDANDLNEDQTSHLGFPIIKPEMPDYQSVTGSLHIL